VMFTEGAERNKALGVWGAVAGSGAAAGVLLGGAITELLGWQWIFLVNVPIGAIALWITLTKVRESKDPFPRSLDYPGQVTLVSGMFLLVLALLRGNEQGWGSTPIVLELTFAALSFIAFITIESRSRQPMLPLGLFRNPVFTGTQLAVFSISASLFAVFRYITIYLQNVLGLSAVEAGLVFIPGTMVNFLVAGASAKFIPRLPARLPVGVGLALVAIGMAWFTTADETSSWTVIIPGELIAMAGTGLVNTSLSGLALSILPERQSGLASGIHDTFRQGGIAVGIAALGAFIPAGAGLGGDPVAFVNGFQNALLAGAIAAAVGAVLAMVLIRPERRAAAEVPAAGVAVEAA
jgi:predicted MFS family arabinose efflux permease